jgi:hypothetical protein
VSVARIVMALEPVIKGIAADHVIAVLDVAPDAVPDCPKFVDQAIDAIPTPSLAVPETVSTAEEVEKVAVGGDVMLKVGGAPLGAGLGEGAGAGVGFGVGVGVGAGMGVGTGVGAGVGTGVTTGAGLGRGAGVVGVDTDVKVTTGAGVAAVA